MDNKFSQIWLDTACQQIPDVLSAILMMPNQEDNQLRLLAKWPPQLEQHDDLLAIVKYTLKKREPVCMPNAHTINGQGFDYYALPLPVLLSSFGAFVIKAKHLPASKHKAVLKNLQKSVQWQRLAGAGKDGNDKFYGGVVGLLASCFEQTSYQQGLVKMVSELTGQFNCDRVAFAEYGRHHSRVIALSNSSDFDQRSNLIQLIADAMDEAIEQDNVILFPDPKAKLIQRAHQELTRKFGSGSICTIPLVHDNKIFGAVTLLSNEEKSLDSEALNQCQQTLALVTPFLALKRDQEKSLLLKLGRELLALPGKLFGLKFLKLKLAMLLLIPALVAANMVESEYRVSAEAILEGKIQRVIAAPISGYLLSASVRAGDTVQQGDEMALLNDNDLRLEQSRLNGSLQQSRRKYREALSTRDLVTVRVVKEQINQVNAEIELNQQQLLKTSLAAPFDGIVIEGDLTQMLGSPVERGDTLFKIAPLEGYRIILKVKETEISHVQPGQTGTLALSSLSGHRFPLKVEKIIAVSRADDGKNIFRVEASLQNPPDLLRPGMQGIGKIAVGNQSLWWIWTHELRNWVSLRVWSWWP